MRTFEHILFSIWGKLESILTSFYGWTVAAFIGLLNFIGDEQKAFYGVLGALLLDMFWGVISSVKRKKFILSYLLRETLIKVAIYFPILCCALYIERGLSDTWGIGTRLICTIAAACEVWSSFAHILIIKPNFPFICLFKDALAGEIASKISGDKDKITKILDNDSDSKNEQGVTEQ